MDKIVCKAKETISFEVEPIIVQYLQDEKDEKELPYINAVFACSSYLLNL